MKIVRFLVVLAVLVLAASLVRAVPVIIYRYSPGVPIKVDLTKNIDVISLFGSVVKGTKNWARDDAPWTPGKRILLMIGGYPYDGKPCRDGLVALAAHYSKPRTIGGVTLPAYDVIYVAEYPRGYHINETAALIADIVRARCQNWPKGMKLDIYGHSMGGLIARDIVESPKAFLGTENISDRVSHLVMMGTPQYGFYEIDVIKKLLGSFPEVDDMNASGDFLAKELNIATPQKSKAVNYYCIVGTCSFKPKRFMIGTKKLVDSLEDVHDGLVSINSAGFGLQSFCRSYQKKELELNHNYIKQDPQIFAVIDQWMIKDKWFGDTVTQASVTPVPVQGRIITKFTGGMPILVGKNKEELIKLFGKNDNTDNDMRHPSPYSWVFEFNQFPWCKHQYRPCGAKVDYALNYCFVPFGMKDSPDGYSKIYSQSFDSKDTAHQFLPREVVPAEVLALEPDLYCWRDANLNIWGNLVVVWFINGNTFLLEFLETPQYQILAHGTNAPHYLAQTQHMTDIVRNFRKYPLLSFSVILGKPDLYTSKRGNEGYYLRMSENLTSHNILDYWCLKDYQN